MDQIIPVPAFSDNYIWLMALAGKAGPDERERRHVAIVDPGQARPVIPVLRSRGLAPCAILVTHHHYDHVDGIHTLLEHHPVPVYGPAGDRVPAVDHPVREGDEVPLGDTRTLRVIEVPGHTNDHIAYYGNGVLFCGDTLFAGGCGRLFEGTARQMYASLMKLAALPGDTRIYCAHEYTLANLRFAACVEPGNRDIKRRIRAARRLRDRGLPTLPSTLDEERRTNPFLRCGHRTVVAAAERFCGRRLKDDAEVFAVLRYWKDTF